MDLSTNDYAAVCWTQLWQVTVLIVAVGVLVRLFGRHRPHLSYVLWMLVVVKCLAPPLWSSPTGVFSWAQGRVAVPSATAVRLDDDMADLFLDPDDPRASTVTLNETAERARWPVPPLAMLGVLWAAGFVMLAMIVLFKWVGCYRLVKGSTLEADHCLQSLAADLGMRRKPRLVVTSSDVGPAVLGVFRPSVLLPEAVLRGKDTQEIEPILAHELVHIRRGDTLFGALQVLAQLLWWFHPLVWWANRQASREAERCCDEEVVAGLGCKPALYARCLLDVMKRKQSLQPVFGFPGVRPVEVTSRRLENIMSRAHRFHRRTPWTCWGIALVAAVLILPGAAFEEKDQNTTALGTNEPKTIEESLAAFHKVDLEPGQVTIEGRCHDGEDNSLSGIDVALLYRNYKRRIYGFVIRTKTDELGEFQFSGLNKTTRDEEGYVTYYVVAWAPHRASGLTGWSPGHPRVLDIPMPKPATMTGRVIDIAGKPIQGAFVRFNWMPPERSIVGLRSAKTDQNGRFAVTDLIPLSAEDFGRSRPVFEGFQTRPVYQFRVHHPDFEERRVRYERMPDDIEVVLQSGATITGRVLYEDSGLPAAGVPVSLQGVHDRDADFDNDPTDWAETETDGAGRYRLTSLREGKYNVWAEAPGWTAVALDSFELEVGQTSEAPELKFIKGGFLAGRLVDNHSGEKVQLGEEYVSVGIYGSSRPRSGAAIDGGRVDSDGTFRFRLPPGEHYVYLSGTGPFQVHGGGDRGARSVEIRASETTGIEFRVSR